MLRLALYLLTGLLLSSCGREPLFPPLAATYPADTGAGRPLVLVLPAKNKGQLTVQLGAGNVAGQTQAPRARGPVVVGDGNTVAPPPERWPPWRWAFVGAAAALVLRQLVPWVCRRWVPRLLARSG